MAKNRPTILQIIPHLDAGGAERSAVEIAHALVIAGARALVLTEGGRLGSGVAEAGAELRLFPAATKNPIRMLANIHTLTRVAAVEGIDLFHARSRAPAWSALAAARRSGAAFVTTYHGAYNETSQLKALYNSVMARGDVVIANSRYTSELIQSRYRTPVGRIEVIHRGVDVRVFDPAAVEESRVSALRAQWGIEEGQRVVLQAARLTGWKGQLTVIEAAGALAAAGRLDDVVFVLAGDPQGRDDYVEQLKRQIADMKLTRAVRLVGHVEDMAAACLAAHVTVIASIEPEAFGRTAIEAAALGCPVIATEIGAPPETVLAEPIVGKGDITGWLVPPGNAGTLARVLSDALALKPEARAAMGKRARTHVLAHFTKEAMQRRTLAVYDRLLGTSLEGRFLSRLPATQP